ncbi:MAG: cytochrome c-type biogenesis protein [Luteimonas sp.]
MTAARPEARRALRGTLAAVLALAFAIGAPLLAFAPPAAAQVSDPAPLRFRDGAEEARFRALVSRLRCVMCQNQSLADSNAQIAYDLRREVLDLMREGRSDAEIERFLVARYGEFVLYRPRVESKTWLLWFGPALLLLAGGVVVARIVRRHAGGGGAQVEADDGQEW